MTSSASRPQPLTGSRSRMAVTSSRGAPASRQAPRAMSPAIPAKQWNQATVVTASRRPFGVHFGLTGGQKERRSSGAGPFQGAEDPGGGAGGAVAVVDAHHGDAGGAAGQHGQEGRDALQ